LDTLLLLGNKQSVSNVNHETINRLLVVVIWHNTVSLHKDSSLISTLDEFSLLSKGEIQRLN
jgi:hypothetical protein